jgi:two-component system chemotaxis response regulator CheB
VGLVAGSVPERADYIWHPSVERMVASAARELDPRHLAGVLLTGMGNDGAPAMTELQRQGGKTIAESEETAIIFGMPAELIALGGAEVVLPCDRIAHQLIEWVGQGGHEHGTDQANT